jgi:hypothetical protein
MWCRRILYSCCQASIFSRASANDRNQCIFRHSSRKIHLNADGRRNQGFISRPLLRLGMCKQSRLKGAHHRQRGIAEAIWGQMKSDNGSNRIGKCNYMLPTVKAETNTATPTTAISSNSTSGTEKWPSRKPGAAVLCIPGPTKAQIGQKQPQAGVLLSDILHRG